VRDLEQEQEQEQECVDLKLPREAGCPQLDKKTAHTDFENLETENPEPSEPEPVADHVADVGKVITPIKPQRFAMFADWVEGPGFAALAAAQGVLVGASLPAARANFVTYRMPLGEEFTQTQWEIKLATSVGMFDRQNKIKPASQLPAPAKPEAVKPSRESQLRKYLSDLANQIKQREMFLIHEKNGDVRDKHQAEIELLSSEFAKSKAELDQLTNPRLKLVVA
jgi:hypothetical protein